MAEITFEFRCKRCGEVFRGTTSDGSYGLRFLVDAMIKGTVSGVVGSNLLTTWEIHGCADKGQGVGELIGHTPPSEGA